MADDSGIENAFASERAQRHLDTFLSETGVNAREGAQRMRASTGRMLVAALLFALIDRDGVADFALGPVRLRELGPLWLALPLAVAFFFRELMLGVIQLREASKAHREAWRAVDERLVWGWRRFAVGPPTMQAWGTLGNYPAIGSSTLARFASGVDAGVFLAVFAGTVAFESYATSRLVGERGGEPTTWIAVACAWILVAHGLSVAQLDMRSDEAHEPAQRFARTRDFVRRMISRGMWRPAARRAPRHRNGRRTRGS